MSIVERIEKTWTGKTLKFWLREEESVTHSLMDDEYCLKQVPLEDGDTVIDIGAHFGETTLLLTTFGKKLDIISIEPVIENFNLLILNIQNNPHDCRISPMTFAIGSKIGLDVANWFHMRNESTFVTLDYLFDRFAISKCKLIVIDCEGCEYDALRATSKETLKKIDYIVGEWHFRSRHELHECVLPLFADKTEEKGIKRQWQDKPPVGLFFFENYTKSS